MKRSEVCIRDPFIMPYNNTYYLYGTRAEQTWGEMDGFDCYTSTDLEEWEGPFEIFHKPEGFFAQRCYWAPECYERNGNFYLVTTLASNSHDQAVYLLTAKNPLGPFEFSHQLTPHHQSCIDGTLCEVKGKTYLVYSHTLMDNPRGEMSAIELDSLTLAPIGEPLHLFYADEAPWATPIPFAKEEFNIDGDAYFTDGPCIITQKDGSLLMLWSSWNQHGYGVGVAHSVSGFITGRWPTMIKQLLTMVGTV
ncbi:family 43 glycosylhydrolase [Alloscardovia omnicolens]|uniref:family 43 glycosylhydrolase n=1 Tax=Alloscardovia omnicolens TaxID=419015 RepID=UPI003A689C5F